MANDKIGRAMRSGRRWAEEQLQAGSSITPELIEQAAMEAYDHRGQQYLFMSSALEVVLEIQDALPKSA